MSEWRSLGACCRSSARGVHHSWRAHGARCAGGRPAGASAPKEVAMLEDAAHIKGSPMGIAAKGSPVGATNQGSPEGEGSPVGATDKGCPVGTATQRAPMKTVAQ